MNANAAKPSAVLPASLERKFIWLLCCLAAVHVYIYAGAFPPINNVDEQMHFDLVVKYSHGHLPRSLEPNSREAMDYIAVYGSLEYLWPPKTFPDGKFPPPPWSQPMDKITPVVLEHETEWQSPNQESSQPPLYYALAALWWDAGKGLGLAGGALFYWVRFLNILLVAALIWLGHFTARMVFPENLFLRLGVPALLAFLPQTAFYSINNDVLSPVCFGAAFVCLVTWLSAETPGAWLGMATGLALAATFLTKIANLPLLAVSALAVLLKLFRLARTKRLRASAPSLAPLFFSAALPMAAWMAWCKVNFGDVTGSLVKIQFLGWTLKPFGAWWHHPIFSPAGAWTFVSGLLATFWQGEFWWHGRPLAAPGLNLVYVLVTLGVLALAFAGRFFRVPNLQRLTLDLALASFAAAVLFLAGLSVIYDFGHCFYPSRAHPYFTSGRLLLGALVPFVLLFLFGMDRALSRFGNLAKFLALAAMIMFMLVSEITVDWPVFSSQYNWFHL